MRRVLPPASLLLVLWAVLLLPGTAAASGLTEAEARGKLLYTTGEAADGREIIAVLGEGGTEVPASALPCVGCHGRRGDGNAEGGLSPSNVQWEKLTLSYGGTGSGGREYEAYTEASLKRAIAMGVDSSGNPLHAAMPRYRLTHDESNDLLAYLKKISSELDPGVTARALRLGVVLPPEGPLDSLAESLRGVLTKRFDLLNETGGLYGRQIELVFLRPPVEGWRRRSAVASFLESERVFALLGSYMAGADAELAALSSAEGVPSIGPFSLRPQVSTPLNPWVFYLWPGLEQQAQAIVRYSAQFDTRAVQTRLVILHPLGGNLDGIRQAIEEQVDKMDSESWSEVDWRPYAPEIPIDLEAMAKNPTLDDLLFVGGETQTASLLQAIGASRWRPRLFLLGPLAGDAPSKAPLQLTDRLFVTKPILPGDYTPAALRLYSDLREEEPSIHVSEELTALAAAETLIEGLRRAGKAVSRQNLVESLETLFEFQTGFAPPLTFTANRRVGALGAYVTRPEPGTGQYMALGGWVTTE